LKTQNETQHAYSHLTPDTVLDAIETLGFVTNGRLLALNSYENRVYQVGVEDGRPLVAKFYRPARWSNAAILEEHGFTQALALAEIPVIAPLVDKAAKTLHEHQGFRFSIYPNCGGRWPELGDPDKLSWIGRFIGRIHAFGAVETFKHRPSVDIDTYGWQAFDYLMSTNYIATELHEAYSSIVKQVLRQVEACFALVPDIKYLRIHADCHPGNILWTDDGPHFVDFDDTRMGPAVQDLWMLLSGDRQEMTEQLADVLEGYTEFFDFNPVELHLLEALRTLRMIHYSAWLARRWNDPSFPINFPWFESVRYWEEQILSLKEQSALMDEGPLIWR